MNTTRQERTSNHRKVRVGPRVSGATRLLRAFFEDDGDWDGYEEEIRRMIDLSGMVSPQYDMSGIDLQD